MPHPPRLATATELRRRHGLRGYRTSLNPSRRGRIRTSSRRRVRRVVPIRGTQIRRVDGVLEGGGTLGLAYTGYLAALGENKVWFRRIVGNSAGAITAAAIAAGYDNRELEFLTAPDGLITRPPSIPAGVQPIRFDEFLDLPTVAEINAVRDQTATWKLIRLAVLDPIFQTPLPIPTRGALADQISSDIASSFGVPRGAARSVIFASLALWPDTQPTLADLMPLTDQVRDQIAATVWTGLAGQTWFRATIGLLHLGGLFRGQAFLAKIRELIGVKLGNPNATFADLQIPLALVASNISRARWEIYSSTLTPQMEVAEAVRRSMSIPFFFQPRFQSGDEIVDGGLFDNYPFVLLSAAGTRWLSDQAATGVVGPNRAGTTVLGALLEDGLAEPVGWNAPRAKWRDGRGRPRLVSTPEALAGGNLALGALFNAAPDNPGHLPLIQRALDNHHASGAEDTDRRAAITTGVFHDRDYVEASIPLRGFSWLDFDSNGEEVTFVGMCDRGWQTGMQQLVDAGLIGSFNRGDRPYR